MSIILYQFIVSTSKTCKVSIETWKQRMVLNLTTLNFYEVIVDEAMQSSIYRSKKETF